MARFPAKDVSAWLGDSVPVAMRHYAMATDLSFRAAADPTGCTTDAKPTPEAPASGGCITEGAGTITATSTI